MKKVLTSLVLALGATAALGTASSAATCADRAHVVSQLEQRFGETLIANAISSRNHVLEVYATPDVSTWSILITIPERRLACLAATGEGREELALAMPGR